jgi:hypothetical protein
MDALIRVRVPVLEDDNGREGDLLPITIQSADIECPAGLFQPEFTAWLSKEEWTTFTLRTGPYDPNWTTKVEVRVVPPGEET